MKCRICGKQIETGTLCDSCYNEYNNEKKEVVSDEKEVLKIRRSYIKNYQLINNWQMFLFFGICLLASLVTGNILEILLIVCFVVICGVCIMFFEKKLAENTKCIFYETKVEYISNHLFYKTHKVLNYSDIKDITYGQTRLQKKFGLGNLNVVSKKGGVILNGFIVENVADISNVFQKMIENVGTRIF